MPFVEPRSRDRIKLLGAEACENVGDICFVFYSHIMKAWREEPRWRTAHRMFRQFSEEPETNEFFQYVYDRVQQNFELADVVCAAKLAYKVFFELHVMPYELEKQKEHGDI